MTNTFKLIEIVKVWTFNAGSRICGITSNTLESASHALSIIVRNSSIKSWCAWLTDNWRSHNAGSAITLAICTSAINQCIPIITIYTLSFTTNSTITEPTRLTSFSIRHVGTGLTEPTGGSIEKTHGTSGWAFGATCKIIIKYYSIFIMTYMAWY